MDPLNTFVIFDFDGVISKEKTGEQKTSCDWLRELFDEDYKKCLTGEATLHHRMGIKFPDGLPDGSSKDEFIERWIQYGTLDIDGRIIDIINQLRGKGYRVCMGTNQVHERINRIESLIGDKFNAIFASARIGAMKPDPAFYKHIQRELGSGPGDIIFIDDSVNNVAAALDLGWNAHHYQGDISELEDYLRSKGIQY